MHRKSTWNSSERQACPVLSLCLTAFTVGVSQAVRAIGRSAINLEKAAERCINVLLELIETKVNYVIQEAIVVIKVRTEWQKVDDAYCSWCGIPGHLS